MLFRGAAQLVHEDLFAPNMYVRAVFDRPTSLITRSLRCFARNTLLGGQRRGRLHTLMGAGSYSFACSMCTVGDIVCALRKKVIHVSSKFVEITGSSLEVLPLLETRLSQRGIVVGGKVLVCCTGSYGDRITPRVWATTHGMARRSDRLLDSAIQGSRAGGM